MKKWDRRWYKEFKDEEVAARVYDVAALLLHGPDAELNFDGEPPPSIPREQIIAWLVKAGLLRLKPRALTTPEN